MLLTHSKVTISAIDISHPEELPIGTVAEVRSRKTEENEGSPTFEAEEMDGAETPNGEASQPMPTDEEAATGMNHQNGSDQYTFDGRTHSDRLSQPVRPASLRRSARVLNRDQNHGPRASTNGNAGQHSPQDNRGGRQGNGRRRDVPRDRARRGGVRSKKVVSLEYVFSEYS